MTRTSKLSIVAAALVATVVATGTVVPTPIAGQPAEPFWQLQGAGPSIAAEPDVMVALRTASRQAPSMVVAAR